MLAHACSCGKPRLIVFFVAIGWALAMRGAGERDGPRQVLSDGIYIIQLYMHACVLV